MSRIFLVGDLHGNFEKLLTFIDKAGITKNDNIILLGDTGINYYVEPNDDSHFFTKDHYIYKDTFKSYNIKDHLQSLGITLLCLQGNHDARPECIEGYQEIDCYGAKAYQQPDYPNLIFLKDGELYTIKGKTFIAIGGAYSIDKFYRQIRYESGFRNFHWFPEEQLDAVGKQRVEDTLERNCWHVDYVLSHTAPYNYMPVDAFLVSVDQSTVDNSMEKWLQTIHDRVTYKRWYCGHYHIDRLVDDIRIVMDDLIELRLEEEEG